MGLHLSNVGEGSTGGVETIGQDRVTSLGDPNASEGPAVGAGGQLPVSTRPAGKLDPVPGQADRRRLPPARIAHVVRLNHGRMRACYQQGLVQSPSLAGRVTVRFVIEPDGHVGLASAIDELGDGAVAACIAKAFQGLRFPASGGEPIVATYPLRLSPRD